MSRMSTISFVALGGNLDFGDLQPQETLGLALVALAQAGVEIRAISKFYRTPCFPEGAGPDYVNAVIAVASTGSAEQLLEVLQATEGKFARTRETRWGMRTLDLDLVYFGKNVLPSLGEYQRWQQLSVEDQVATTPIELILPHPRIQDRSFVLVPLHDIAPNLEHPVTRKTTSEMLAKRPKNEVLSVKAL